MPGTAMPPMLRDDGFQRQVKAREAIVTRLDPNRAGLVLAAVIGGWHLLWSLLVAFGWAQPVIDFVFWMHFIKPVYVVEPFTAGKASILIAVTALVGYGTGGFFGIVWNRLHR